MTFGDIIAQMEAISADILHTSVDRLPHNEQLHRFFPAGFMAMDATLEWFETPRQDGEFVEGGEIRIPQMGFRYGILENEYTQRFHEVIPANVLMPSAEHSTPEFAMIDLDDAVIYDHAMSVDEIARRATSDGAGE